jgi:CRISPR-associated endonuclease/helicase Cas3
MLVWLLALASQASEGVGAVLLPRRFVMVVDRRTVVDQATEVAEGLKRWLDANPDHPVTVALAALSSKTHLPAKHPLSISTLRGERADNGNWKRDPARPAIIVGTVYKIGSRLLFWGDGDGRSMRSMHTGLLGQDVLLVHDEAHLSPAFAKLLRKVERLQQRWPTLRPFHCVELTATPSAADGEALRLPEADRSNPAVARRLFAEKTLSLQKLADDVTPAAKRAAIVEQAIDHADACKTVLIYVTSPDDAAAIASDLHKQAKHCDVRLLTGTLRGHERDQLAHDPVFQRFQRRQKLPCTTYLVSTSAGAVGIDLDADAAIFDLCTLDNFIQRAGRINRSGGDGRTAPVTLIYACSDFADKRDPSKIERPRLLKTLELLQQLPATNDGHDASPAALTELVMHPDYESACTAMPRMRELDDALLDTWSMTSLRPRIGPEVVPWLRGISANDPTQTVLVWRELPNLKPLPERHNRTKGSEPNSIENDLWGAVLERNKKHIDSWLSAYPIRAAEKSTLRTDRTQQFLKDLATRLGKDEGDTMIPVLSGRDAVELVPLSILPERFARLAEATVILPSRLGGLSNGYPDAGHAEHVSDVADQTGIRERWHLSLSDDTWTATGAAEPLTFAADSLEQVVKQLEKERQMRAIWRDDLDDDSGDSADATSATIYLVNRQPAFPDDGEGGSQAVNEQPLDVHLPLVRDCARAIGIALGLDQGVVERLAHAGAAHDLGKNRPWWQQAAGNFSDAILAKCFGRRANWRRLRGYRHEFGSLLDLADEGIDDDLILHLVACHHGRARPGFEAKAFDNSHSLAQNEQASYDSELRFDRLQQRYGWWGLAYLEALVKCADAMGSREAGA